MKTNNIEVQMFYVKYVNVDNFSLQIIYCAALLQSVTKPPYFSSVFSHLLFKKSLERGGFSCEKMGAACGKRERIA